MRPFPGSIGMCSLNCRSPRRTCRSMPRSAACLGFACGAGVCRVRRNIPGAAHDRAHSGFAAQARRGSAAATLRSGSPSGPAMSLRAWPISSTKWRAGCRSPTRSLEQKVERRTRELSEALQRQTAMSDVLHVISSSSGDLQPAFEALLANAAHVCNAAFGVIYLHEQGMFRAAALHGASPDHAALEHRRDAFRFRWQASRSNASCATRRRFTTPCRMYPVLAHCSRCRC